MDREEIHARFERIKERAFRKVDDEWQRALGRAPRAPEPEPEAVEPPAPAAPRGRGRRRAGRASARGVRAGALHAREPFAKERRSSHG